MHKNKLTKLHKYAPIRSTFSSFAAGSALLLTLRRAIISLYWLPLFQKNGISGFYLQYGCTFFSSRFVGEVSSSYGSSMSTTLSPTKLLQLEELHLLKTLNPICRITEAEKKSRHHKLLQKLRFCSSHYRWWSRT